MKGKELELKKQENEWLQTLHTHQTQMFKTMVVQQQQGQKQEKESMSQMFKAIMEQQQQQQRQMPRHAEIDVDATANSNTGLNSINRKTWYQVTYTLRSKILGVGGGGVGGAGAPYKSDRVTVKNF